MNKMCTQILRTVLYIYEKNQTTCSYNWLKSIVNEILQKQFEQEMRNLVDNSSK